MAWFMDDATSDSDVDSAAIKPQSPPEPGLIRSLRKHRAGLVAGSSGTVEWPETARQSAVSTPLVICGSPLQLQRQAHPLRDGLGGIWERVILAQGNAVFSNPADGNRIVVLLR
jgi:hypothetical protein